MYRGRHEIRRFHTVLFEKGTGLFAYVTYVANYLASHLASNPYTRRTGRGLALPEPHEGKPPRKPADGVPGPCARNRPGSASSHLEIERAEHGRQAYSVAAAETTLPMGKRCDGPRGGVALALTFPRRRLIDTWRRQGRRPGERGRSSPRFGPWLSESARLVFLLSTM